MPGPPTAHPQSQNLSPALLLLVLLHDLLHNLLLLDQERAHNSVLDTVGTATATIGALDGLLGARDGGVFARPKSWDACQF